MWSLYVFFFFFFKVMHVMQSIHLQNSLISRDNPSAVHNTRYAARYVSVQMNRGLCVVTEEGRWRNRGEIDEAERWQALSVTWRRRFEVTGPTLKQEISTSARLSHQRCMAVWQILRMFHWETSYIQADFGKLDCGLRAAEKLWMLGRGRERISGRFRVIQETTTRNSLPTWFQLRMVPPLTDCLFHHKRQVINSSLILYISRRSKRKDMSWPEI